MATQSLRIRLIFDDSSVLSVAQRSDWMDQSWILIEPSQYPKISDLSNHLLHKFNLRNSCPNGILLLMEGFVLPQYELTRILKDNDIICVKRKGLALAEGIEGADACNLVDQEVNRREPVDNGALLLANKEFVKEAGGYQSESEDAEVEMLEDKPLPGATTSKKRKASTKHRSSKKKNRRFVATDDAEDEAVTEDNNIKNDECLIIKKIKSNKGNRSGESETIIEKVKSPSKVKRKKKHHLGVVIGDEDEAVTGEIKNVNNGESVFKEKVSKKKIKPNEEIKMANAEASGKIIKDDVEGVKQTSNVCDEAKKVSRSTKRKKAKRQWRLELTKSLQNADNHVEPKVSKTKNNEANDHVKELLKQYQVPAVVTHKNIIEQEVNHTDNGASKLVPCVVRPGHIRFEPLDEDEDTMQIETPEVTFRWNGITSKKKGQKWGLEKFSTFKRDDTQKATEEASTMSSVAASQVPLIDLTDFDQLPLCSSPKEGDVIVYRVLELSSSWTPELSPFRVGKISYYDADDIVLVPVPEYPIVLDKMDENGPENTLYKEDGSLEIKYAALADVRSLKQSNPDAMKACSNEVNQTPQVDDKISGSNFISRCNGNKENFSKDPSPVVGNKEWDELQSLLTAKKSELLETNEEMKRDSGWNKWSYRALRGSALGPTISLLRSENGV